MGDHEAYSAAIITANGGLAGELRQVIEANQEEFLGITPEEISEVLTGQALGLESFLHEMMSGDLDADRMDYLQRDSLYCGVRYGRFDSERLVKTLTCSEGSGGNPVLAIDEDGIHAAEGLILSRYFMFTQVYFHRVRRAYDYHLGEALRGLLTDGKYPAPDDLDEYLRWDDLRVQVALRDIAGNGSQPGEHARRILERDHYRVAYSTRENPTPGQVRRWDQLCARVRGQFPESTAFDAAEKAPHKFNRSLRDFPVVKRPGDPPTSIEEESSLIGKLEELNLRRILSPQAEIGAIQQFCDGLNLNVR